MKSILQCIRVFIFFTLLIGVAYPALVTFASHILYSNHATGGLLQRNGKVVGSHLIAQKFESPRYFWGRPSAVDFNPLPSGGGNQSQISGALKTQVAERRAKLRAAHPDQADAPQDLLFASGSGLDPHVSPSAAHYQVTRVARVRGLKSEEIRALVNLMTEERQFGILGEPRVNILKLNLALDELVP